MTREVRCDVLVAGGGIAGLWIARALGAAGMKVVLAEKSDHLGAGATLQNEGWLHSGAYHASSIRDERLAVRTARQCVFGYAAIRSYATDCIEFGGVDSVAITGSRELADVSEDRWRQAGVTFRPLSVTELATSIPSVRLRDVCAAYVVGDVAVNVARLVRKLAGDIEAQRNRIELDTEVKFGEDGTPSIASADAIADVRAGWTILATGADVDPSRFADGGGPSIRLWKSHLLRGPQFLPSPLFWLDPLKISVINHLPRSTVIGVNEDAYRVESGDRNIDLEIVERHVELLSDQFPSVNVEDFVATACIKVDAESEPRRRGVHGFCRQVGPRAIWVCPGKMTQTPFVVRMVERIITGVADRSTTWEPIVE